ncbi:alpha-amylase family protein [Thalassoglobus neptunius]|uniref:hypothetical protein n=1 Tax=Thalassoglobus neptunius TaxID=1938619 RepID=UPI0011B47377|nr:hypothetical protein [Thalassoglobus neptunius]
MLRKSIVEASGADAHFLQPGLGWIPWWSSNIYSIEDHHRWLRDTFKVKGVRKVGRFLLEGGDLLATLVDACRQMNQAPFLSYRLNDGHHVRELAEALKRGRPTPNMARHYWDNYERFRIGPDQKSWDNGVFDWSFPEVRDYNFSLIEEACSNYDLAGLELDFLRHWVRFGPKTKQSDRLKITTDFVRRIRKMLDRTAADRGLPRWSLCVRVPAAAKVRPDQGVDLAALVDAGVDMVNLSHSYFTWQDDSVAVAKRQVGEAAAVYLEMTHATMTGKATNGSGTQPFLRTTDQQFYTSARIAYDQGAQGVSLFNFPYYRYHVAEQNGPFHEPPFHVLPRLKDEQFLRSQSESYFLSSGRNDPILGEKTLPTTLKRGHPQTLSLAMLPAEKERAEGLIRLRSDGPIDGHEIDVHFNDSKLSPVPAVTNPLSHRYENTWLGSPEEFACFALPASVPMRATNELKVVVRQGARVRLIYLDVILQ